MQLTAFARGYLALVGALEQGRGLSQGADFLQPTVEIADLLGLAQREFYQGTVNFNISTFTGPPELVVPAGRIWRVLNFTGNWQSGAVVITSPIYLAVRLPDDAAPATPTMLALGAQSLAINTALACAYNGELWLPSGARLGGYCAITTGTLSLTGSVLVEEFPG